MDFERAGAGVKLKDADGVTLAASQRIPRKRVIGRRAATEKAAAKIHGSDAEHTKSALSSQKPARPPRALNQVPTSISEDSEICAAISMLPTNYNFEIPKTIHRIRTSGAKNVALQFPEGLLLFAPMISDILVHFCPGTDTLIMGDVTYGACCVDDYTARALGCDLLVHYGHSCLVPMTETGGIKTLYVFVTIGIDIDHLVKSIERSFPAGKQIALVGTIQFNTTLHAIVPRLRASGYKPILPRSAPLSAGEILGCTAPTLTSPASKVTSQSQQQAQNMPSDTNPAVTNADMILYVGDGRFHLESILIASPALRAHTYRYDPYARKLTHETYDHEDMHSLRRTAVRSARETLRLRRQSTSGEAQKRSGQLLGVEASIPTSMMGKMSNLSERKEIKGDESAKEKAQDPSKTNPTTWGLILGTLGRQGNPHTLDMITSYLEHRSHPYITLLLSEITPQKLALLSDDVGVWVQVACPRLSIDWGYAFRRPLLSPYEACVALGIKESAEWAGGDELLDDGNEDNMKSSSQQLSASAATALISADIGTRVDVYPMDYYEKNGLGRVRPEHVRH